MTSATGNRCPAAKRQGSRRPAGRDGRNFPAIIRQRRLLCPRRARSERRDRLGQRPAGRDGRVGRQELSNHHPAAEVAVPETGTLRTAGPAWAMPGRVGRQELSSHHPAADVAVPETGTLRTAGPAWAMPGRAGRQELSSHDPATEVAVPETGTLRTAGPARRDRLGQCPAGRDGRTFQPLSGSGGCCARDGHAPNGGTGTAGPAWAMPGGAGRKNFPAIIRQRTLLCPRRARSERRDRLGQRPAGRDGRNFPTISRQRRLLCPRRARSERRDRHGGAGELNCFAMNFGGYK